MSNYLNLGPNVIGSVTVAPPPLGQPLSGETIVAISDTEAVWGQGGSGGDASSLNGLNIAVSPPASAGQMLMVNSSANGLLWQGFSGDATISATTIGQVTVTGFLGMPLPSPTVAGSALTYDGSGLVWSSAGGVGSFTAGGDLAGTSTSQTVRGLHNYSLPVPNSAWYDDNLKYYVWAPFYNYPSPWDPQTVPPGPAGQWRLIDIPDSTKHITGEEVYSDGNGGNFYFGAGVINANSIHNFNIIIGSPLNSDPTSFNLLLDTASFAELDPVGDNVYYNNVIVNIFDSNGGAGSVPINITTNTPTLMIEQGLTTTISGNSSYVINQNYGSVSLILSVGLGTSNYSHLVWNWTVLSHT